MSKGRTSLVALFTRRLCKLSAKIQNPQRKRFGIALVRVSTRKDAKIAGDKCQSAFFEIGPMRHVHVDVKMATRPLP